MDLISLILLIFLVGTFSIFPGIMMAIEDTGTRVKNFFVGALLIPSIGVWSALEVLVMYQIPDAWNAFWGFSAFLFVFIGGGCLGAYLLFKLLVKLYK